MAKTVEKPATDLLTQLQQAVAVADAAQAESEKVSAAATSKVNDAKAAYEQILQLAKDEMQAAADKTNAANDVVLKLQDELSHLLGRYDSRVRKG